MAKLFILLILFAAGCWACKSTATDPIAPVVTECVGSSDYIIRNESHFDLSVELVFSESLGNKIDSLQTISPQQTKKVAQDGSFGYITRPTDTFSRLVLYRIVDGRRVIAYAQEPVINERWTKVKRNATDPDYGCYSVTNTLMITDADIKLL